MEHNRIKAESFWKWAYSDFLSNALRGVLAEYIVATAVGCVQAARTEWDACDLRTDDGLKIEVKSSSYLQTWNQKRLSAVRFDIGRKMAWDAETNTSSSFPLRTAHVYVFCVFANTDKATADPLDLSQWFFLVCPRTLLDEKHERQKSIGLKVLVDHGLERLTYAQLASAVNAAVVR